MSNLVIIGAGGHGKVVADAALLSKNWEAIVFYDDSFPKIRSVGNLQIVGKVKDLLEASHNSSSVSVVVAIGNNHVRYKIYNELLEKGYSLPVILHPSSIISSSAKIGAGSVVLAGAVVNADAIIHASCIINSNAVIEHDCVINDGAHICPGSLLAGGVYIGKYSWIGIGATVIQSVNIGDNVVVGAGAVVLNALPSFVTAVGVPAKIIKY
ncbi:MAG: NeuD/PglB/VioB family sugar acetyltransferase [Paraglaciecola sp.]|nr:NeuD/PglB/VioB family sugar acetyltransferase [Paraglaciecola sp.]